MVVDEAFIDQHSVEMPAATFPLGASMRLVDRNLRLRDRHRRLNLAGLLHATPYKWVWQDTYRIGRTLVTNGQYRDFLTGEGAPFDSAVIWNHVWKDQGLRIDSYTRFDQGSDGRVFDKEEYHNAARNFVDAYIDSLESEVLQWADYESGPAYASDDPNASGDSQAAIDPRERKRVVQRAFAWVKTLVADAIVGPGSDVPFLDHKQQAAVELYFQDGGPGLLTSDLNAIRTLIKQRLSLVLPPKQRSKLEQDCGEMVEAVALLDRAERAWERHDHGRRVPLHLVLHPRGWPRDWETIDSSQSDSAGFFAPKVPWEDQPVFGLSLYEAAAYCAWLSSCSGWKRSVELPTEAQYERAASWPTRQNDVIGDRCVLDPRAKHLFPWQGGSNKDFNDLFGQEQNSLDLIYSDPPRWEKLLQESARTLEDGQRLDQLLGFGWQWCRERFDSAERRYSRFENEAFGRQPFFVEDKVKSETLPVFTYAPNISSRHSHFVVRGAPEVLGGPGLTTRRFAMYPLRGYPDVGFRWVATRREGY